jgi:His/Glu/Gln/Arg/opine family amino acid ABC transporter permease subunit
VIPLPHVFALAQANTPALLGGLGMSLAVLGLSSVAGFAMSVPVALAAISRAPWLRWPARTFNTAFRGSPLFVQIFLIYFGLPMALARITGAEALRASVLWPLLASPFLLTLIAFSLNLAAYMAEDLRGGLQAVPRGELEAAQAAGMSYGPQVRRILLPRAIQLTLPSLFNQVILTFKATALVNTVTLRDLLGVGNDMFSDTYDLTAYLIVGLIYLVCVYLMTVLFRSIERRISR